jgi:hypothetical protein
MSFCGPLFVCAEPVLAIDLFSSDNGIAKPGRCLLRTGAIHSTEPQPVIATVWLNVVSIPCAGNSIFAPFVCKNDRLTKTGSGQT